MKSALQGDDEASALQPVLDFLVAARRSEIRDLEQLALACDLVRAVAGLVHQLQRERGVSQIYLASGGRRFAAQWDDLIVHGEAAQAPVRAWVDGFGADGVVAGGARLLTRIAVALHALFALPDLRRDVRARACTPEQSVQRYNRLVGALLALVFEAADVTVEPDVSRQLVALFNLMQAKEYAGQERAAGAAAFAAGRIGEDEVHALHVLLELQDQCLQRFETFCAPDVRRQWGALTALMPVSELDGMRRALAAPGPSGHLDAGIADEWFHTCSTRIDLIHQVETHLAGSLQHFCGEKITARRAGLADGQTTLAALSAVSGPPGPQAVVVTRVGMGVTMPAGAQATREGAGTDQTGDGQLLAGTGVGPKLARSIVDSLQAQASRLQAMGEELAAVRASLDERKVVERAKGLLMARQRLSEEQAYRLLRQWAMNQGRRLVDIAQTVLSVDGEPPVSAD